MRVEFNGVIHELDEESLTWEEADLIEQKSGKAFGSGSMLTNAATMWVLLKRGDTDLTWRDFVTLPVAAVHILDEPEEPAGAEADPDPQSPPASPPSTGTAVPSAGAV